MKLFSWLMPRKAPTLSLAQQQRLLRLPESAGLGDHALRAQRWVVVDLETSGLNLNRDQVLSIGAMVIEDGAIDFSQTFERTLLRTDNPLSPSVLLHGLGPSAIAAGSDRPTPCWTLWRLSVTARCWPFTPRLISTCSPVLSKTAWVTACNMPLWTWQPWRPCSARSIRAARPGWITGSSTQPVCRRPPQRQRRRPGTAELALILFSRARAQGIDSPQALQQRLNQWQRRKIIHSF